MATIKHKILPSSSRSSTTNDEQNKGPLWSNEAERRTKEGLSYVDRPEESPYPTRLAIRETLRSGPISPIESIADESGLGISAARSKNQLLQTKPNQDLLSTGRINTKYRYLLVIDGHGPNGLSASRLINVYLPQYINEHIRLGHDVPEAVKLATAKLATNEEHWIKIILEASGAVFILAIFDDQNNLLLANLGDSGALVKLKLQPKMVELTAPHNFDKMTEPPKGDPGSPTASFKYIDYRYTHPEEGTKILKGKRIQIDGVTDYPIFAASIGDLQFGRLLGRVPELYYVSGSDLETVVLATDGALDYLSPDDIDGLTHKTDPATEIIKKARANGSYDDIAVGVWTKNTEPEDGGKQAP